MPAWHNPHACHTDHSGHHLLHTHVLHPLCFHRAGGIRQNRLSGTDEGSFSKAKRLKRHERISTTSQNRKKAEFHFIEAFLPVKALRHQKNIFLKPQRRAVAFTQRAVILTFLFPVASSLPAGFFQFREQKRWERPADANRSHFLQSNLQATPAGFAKAVPSQNRSGTEQTWLSLLVLADFTCR
ncbi:hypothetical protein [Oecophyllibacter saccharovorans]|uniref:hypothetical protein n=1 Tax=Oecophyllibacter saccharovorans TaxID=2558360 RepID=UPI001170204F|nr:hypothetical protein [Oecophyllibacter saccharovorans]TPW33745.1 hypothetical protein E3203_08085 [Oecophyllibacter saccharovorans]